MGSVCIDSLVGVIAKVELEHTQMPVNQRSKATFDLPGAGELRSRYYARSPTLLRLAAGYTCPASWSLPSLEATDGPATGAPTETPAEAPVPDRRLLQTGGPMPPVPAPLTFASVNLTVAVNGFRVEVTPTSQHWDGRNVTFSCLKRTRSQNADGVQRFRSLVASMR